MKFTYFRIFLLLAVVSLALIERARADDDKKDEKGKDADKKKDLETLEKSDKKKDKDDDDDDKEKGKKDGDSKKDGAGLDMSVSDAEHLLKEMEVAGNPLNAFYQMVAQQHEAIHEYEMENGKPKFCGEHECPKYKVLCKSRFYEVRKYEPAKYIRTKVEWGAGDDGMSDPIKAAFLRLNMYNKGKNEKGAKMNMTVPVFVHTKDVKKPFKEMYMKFLINEEFQKDPPKPKDSKVEIMDTKENVYYVKMFGGYNLNSMWAAKVAKFAKTLKALGQSPDISFGSVGASYDKPSKIENRHNEILMKAEEKKDDKEYCKIKAETFRRFRF